MLLHLLGHYLNSRPEAERVRTIIAHAQKEQVPRVSIQLPPRPQARLTAGQNAKITELYKSGMRAIDIARKLGVTEWTVHHRLNRLGIERRIVGMNETDKRQAMQMYELGESRR